MMMRKTTITEAIGGFVDVTEHQVPVTSVDALLEHLDRFFSNEPTDARHAAEVRALDESNGLDSLPLRRREQRHFWRNRVASTGDLRKGKWQDAKTVPVASLGITKYSADKKFEASYASDSYVGTRHVQQTSDGHGQFTLFATVVAFNPDDTAHVVIDLDDAGWQKHIDATVPVNAATAIATDNKGAEHRLTVKRNPA